MEEYSINLIDNPVDTIAYILGVSSSLIESMCREKNKENIYYREFKINKKSGGKRKIEAPRFMLKVVQRFIADYILIKLPIHKNVYSYVNGKSIVDNATRHSNKNYLITMDIEDFFGTITYDKLISYFGIYYFVNNTRFNVKNLYLGRSLSSIIIDLCTKDSALPQGAPTSPVLSNAILYNFDEEISKLCEKNNITYTRYADDISISGDDKDAIKEMQRHIEKILLENYDFKINKDKNKFANKSMQHKVTGVIVNEKVKPSRYWVKKLKQDLNYAVKYKDKRSKEIYKKLYGRVSYLRSFPYYKNEKNDLVEKYLEQLEEIRHKLND